MARTGYAVNGEFVELCDCFSVCPCWIGLAPDRGRCTGVFAWTIASGHVGDVDVAGRSVVSVSFHDGHRDTGGQQVIVFVDEDADDEQFDALVGLFTGAHGGPLEELRRLMGTLLRAERAAIQVASRGRGMTLTVGRLITGDGTVMTGSDGEVTELRHGRLSTVLGPRADVGTSSALSVQVPGLHGVNVRDRSAMRGPFSYVHESDE